MTIKELAYTAKLQLESATHQPFRNAHIHELLAACFGFKSNTSMHTNHVLAVLNTECVIPVEHLLNLKNRLTELGYTHNVETVGSVLLQLMRERRVGVLSVQEAFASLDLYFGKDQIDWDESQDDEAASAQSRFGIDRDRLGLLTDGLRLIAKRGNAMAHYALAQIYGGDGLGYREGSQYWHSKLAQGDELTGVQLEWAKAYSDNILNAEREAFHLQEAVRLGYPAAQLEMAHLVLEKAHEKGDFESIKRGYTEAARLGDVAAMRALIDEYDEANLFQNWVWVFFSELLGNDLRKSSLRAYHDGGMYADQDYDDDQGGPLYIGGNEGVELAEIDAELERNAREVAGQLFGKLTA
ncbi:hypothetical protein [Halopseudomonas sabulinigri]|uniref:Sel1 repeat family protein n=1 Tax=Halopseudomonas sabulinigri TaxID=472181 RepID=A0ABP9ZS62_9GAMM